MNRRAIIRRRRGYWTLGVILLAVLAREAVYGDYMRCAVLVLVLACWLGIRREFLYGGLR